MFRPLTLRTFAEDAVRAARDALAAQLEAAGRGDPAATFHRLAPAVPGGANGGDLVWHVHYPDEAAWSASATRGLAAEIGTDPAVHHVDSCAYRPQGAHLREPAFGPGVYRALFVVVRPGAAPERVARFAADVAAMPDYIPQIRNWALSPVAAATGARGWTHVWEQEFAAVEDLRGPYMASPYHWGFVDRWFDPEHHDHLVDGWLCHSVSALGESVIARYNGATQVKGDRA